MLNGNLPWVGRINTREFYSQDVHPSAPPAYDICN